MAEQKQVRRKSGPRTVYDRSKTETIRVSSLAKQLITTTASDISRAVGRKISRGEVWEQLARTRARELRPDEFPVEHRT